VTAEIECGELDVADAKLFRGRVKSGLEHGNTIVLQHMEKRSLSGIVKTKEQEFCKVQSVSDQGEAIGKLPAL